MRTATRPKMAPKMARFGAKMGFLSGSGRPSLGMVGLAFSTPGLELDSGSVGVPKMAGFGAQHGQIWCQNI